MTTVGTRLTLLATLLAATTIGATVAPVTGQSATERPVVVGNRYVNPLNGQVLGPVAAGMSGKFASPVRSEGGKFRLKDLGVDAATMTATTAGTIARRNSSIARLGDGGTERWTHPASWSDSWAESEGIVVIGQGRGLVAIDDATGKEIWRSGGPWAVPCAAHGLVVAVELGAKVALPPGSPVNENHTIARRLTDGAEVWRAGSPLGSLGAHILPAGDLFLVREEWLDGPRRLWTRAFAADGSLRFVLDGEAVFAAQQVGVDGETVVVNGERTARLSRDGRELWRVNPSFVAPGAADIDPLADGSLLLTAYDESSDEGVDLAKIDPTTGAIAWRVHAKGLGVGRYGYSQWVYVEVRGNDFVLVSQATGGYFVERRKIASGALIHRWKFDLGFDSDKKPHG